MIPSKFTKIGVALMFYSTGELLPDSTIVEMFRICCVQVGFIETVSHAGFVVPWCKKIYRLHGENTTTVLQNIR